MNYAVLSVKPLDDFKLLLTFKSGERKVYDMKPHLNGPLLVRSTTYIFLTKFVCGLILLNGKMEQILTLKSFIERGNY